MLNNKKELESLLEEKNKQLTDAKVFKFFI